MAKKSSGKISESDISSDDAELPDTGYLRSSKAIQTQVDRRLTQLEQGSHVQGNCCGSKRGGSVEVIVEKSRMAS